MQKILSLSILIYGEKKIPGINHLTLRLPHMRSGQARYQSNQGFLVSRVWVIIVVEITRQDYTIVRLTL